MVSSRHVHLQDPERAKDPVEFVQRLLEMKDKYDKIITQSLTNDKSFQNTLNQVRLITSDLSCTTTVAACLSTQS